MVLFEREFCSIDYDEERKRLSIYWDGSADSREYREVLDAILNIVKTHDIQDSFEDREKMQNIEPADEKYAKKVWMPQFLNFAKVKRSAIVINERKKGEKPSDPILEKTEDVLDNKVRYFTSREDAYDWLGK